MKIESGASPWYQTRHKAILGRAEQGRDQKSAVAWQLDQPAASPKEKGGAASSRAAVFGNCIMCPQSTIRNPKDQVACSGLVAIHDNRKNTQGVQILHAPSPLISNMAKASLRSATSSSASSRSAILYAVYR